MSAAISSAALPPLKAIAHAVALLEAKGFAVRAVNERGDAVYLRRDGHPLDLRVANHARSAKQRQRNRGIAASLVIDAPLTASRLAERVAAALRNYEAGVSDAGISEAGGSGARK